MKDEIIKRKKKQWDKLKQKLNCFVKSGFKDSQNQLDVFTNEKGTYMWRKIHLV